MLTFAKIEVNSKFFEEKKIPPGHQIKITKKIEKIAAESKTHIGMSSTVRNSPQKKNLVIKEPRKQNNAFSAQTEFQITAPSKKPVGGMTEMSDGIGVGTDDGPGSLLNGHFDEKESHQSFLEALLEWRKGKNPPTETNETNGVIKPSATDKLESKGKTVRFDDGTEPKRAEKPQEGVKHISLKKLPKKLPESNSTGTVNDGKSFLFGGGGDTLWSMGDYPSQSDAGTDMFAE